MEKTLYYDTISSRWFTMEYMTFESKLKNVGINEQFTYNMFCELVGMSKISMGDDIQLYKISPKLYYHYNEGKLETYYNLEFEYGWS